VMDRFWKYENISGIKSKIDMVVIPDAISELLPHIKERRG